MKTVLFAITMKGFPAVKATQFEEKTIDVLKVSSRDYADAISVHCDYKEGLESSCKQYRPDCLVVNEELIGLGNIYDLIKDIKSEYPEMLIIVLLTASRMVGDVVLANLTTAGIYNWVVAPWTPESVANAIIAPKKFKDVEMYVPKIVEGPNGLGFETKVVEKIEDKLEDLPDMLTSGTNNAIQVKPNSIRDVGEDTNEEKKVGYSRKLTGGYGFGRIFKPKKVEEVEEPIEEAKEEVKEEAKDEIALTEIPLEKPKTNNFESLLEKIQKRESFEKVEKPQRKPVDFEKINELFTKENAEKKSVEPKKVPAEPKKTPIETKKAQTFGTIEFTPKYKKILFVRALPFSSIIPVHIASIMKAAFVDFNKESINEDFLPVEKSTIKEAKLPESEFVVGDVVAGNGVEKLVEKFDHVVAILPNDAFVIKTFINRYPHLCNGVLIDNCFRGTISRKQIQELLPEVEYFNNFYVDDCYKEVAEALMNNKLLMDNSNIVEGMKYFLKSIGSFE